MEEPERGGVVIEAGQVYDPSKAGVVKLRLPYGIKPGLILLDWNRQAIFNQSPDTRVGGVSSSNILFSKNGKQRV